MPTVRGKTDKIFKKAVKKTDVAPVVHHHCKLFLRFLRDNVQRVLLSVVMHEKQAAVHANMEHVEILDAGVEPVRESDPVRVH